MEAFENIFLEYASQYWLPIGAILLGIGGYQIDRKHDRRLSALDESSDPDSDYYNEYYKLNYYSQKTDIVREKHFSLIQALLISILVMLIAIFLK
tara:strand:- start:1008 stop:1292 length:285 start_codon:yes stop_codon:yes gene_type:complete